MPLRTVRVPPELGPLFEKAEELVSRYFAAQRSDAEHGAIEIQGERYVLVRGAALSVEFFALVEALYGAGREEEAEAFAQSILFDLAHAVGKADARSFHARMGLVDPIERLSAGPVCRFIMAPPSRIEAHVARFQAEGPPRGAPTIPDFFSRQRMEQDLKRRVRERTAELERSNARLRSEIEERERADARLLQTY
jgi:hypothetical protein